eukprot:CAMPEP_0204512506 /NCGR_PEP_ID=MMETSP0661-20131031/987_1 /ASSEMBLY_ACC=CAM_ASM_000606 /TAXON_ID=109239 /ORGANISM="Alexandrium margalefi, Strain AMGDE01CS-322" /LENGTH=130 /DNA_ID=CAMNT_0051517625 /DNA_START=100 /DNA_END=492 /DNA_ORIENTATION=+
MAAMKVMKAMKAKQLVQRGKLGKFVKRDYGKTVKIGGKTYDLVMIEAAKIATKGAGDGRISRSDARLLCKAARPSADGRSSYDAVEKATMAYIRKTYKFTAAGDAAVRRFISGQAAKQALRTKAKKKASK